MIAGTGIKVLDVAIRYEVMGMTPEEIMVALPQLTRPQIHAGFDAADTHGYSYGHNCREENL